jgi:GAF domain-containing protein
MPQNTFLVKTIVELADSLVDEFDVIDLLTLLSNRCVEVLGVDASGVMLAAPGGELQVVASSSEEMRLLELLQVQANEGPCVDCYRSGETIANVSLESTDIIWPTFTPMAIAQGFRSVHCLPLKLRGQTLGALNLFQLNETLALEPSDWLIAKAFADIATIAILQYRTISDASILNAQLSTALNSRIVIEQAKGMIAQAAAVDMDIAFERLRNHSRNNNLGLTDVARSIVVGELDPFAFGVIATTVLSSENE